MSASMSFSDVESTYFRRPNFTDVDSTAEVIPDSLTFELDELHLADPQQTLIRRDFYLAHVQPTLIRRHFAGTDPTQ